MNRRPEGVQSPYYGVISTNHSTVQNGTAGDNGTVLARFSPVVKPLWATFRLITYQRAATPEPCIPPPAWVRAGRGHSVIRQHRPAGPGLHATLLGQYAALGVGEAINLRPHILGRSNYTKVHGLPGGGPWPMDEA